MRRKEGGEREGWRRFVPSSSLARIVHLPLNLQGGLPYAAPFDSFIDVSHARRRSRSRGGTDARSPGSFPFDREGSGPFDREDACLSDPFDLPVRFGPCSFGCAGSIGTDRREDVEIRHAPEGWNGVRFARRIDPMDILGADR